VVRQLLEVRLLLVELLLELEEPLLLALTDGEVLAGALAALVGVAVFWVTGSLVSLPTSFFSDSFQLCFCRRFPSEPSFVGGFPFINEEGDKTTHP
jgi:hypothetical protein